MTVNHENDDVLDVDAQTDQACALIRSGQSDHPLVGQVALIWARRAAARLNRDTLAGSWDDAFAECTAEVVRLLNEFRPGPEGTSVSAYLGAWLPRVVSHVQGQARWHDDPRLRKAAAITEAVRQDLQSFDPFVSEDEIYREALARLHGQYIDTARRDHPAWSETELFDYACARARKDGLDRAFADLRRGSDEFADPVSLDVPNEDGAPRFDVPDSTASSTREEEQYEALLRVILGDHMWARPALGALFASDVDGLDASTLEAAARLVKVSPARLREVRKAARLRATSPVAQWAHLAPELGSTPSHVSFRDE